MFSLVNNPILIYTYDFGENLSIAYTLWIGVLITPNRILLLT